MKTNYTLEALIISFGIIFGCSLIDITVSVNVTDKQIINKLNKDGDNKNIIMPTGKYN